MSLFFSFSLTLAQVYLKYNLDAPQCTRNNNTYSKDKNLFIRL